MMDMFYSKIAIFTGVSIAVYCIDVLKECV